MNIDLERLREALLRRAHIVVQQWLPDGVIRGNELRAGSINGEKGESLGVNLSTGKWKDFAHPAGQAGGADLISLYAAINRISYSDAYKELAGRYLPERKSKRVRGRQEQVMALWPVPSGAPSAPIHSIRGGPGRRGVPKAHWSYRDERGNLLGCVVRIEFQDDSGSQKKEIKPLYYFGPKLGWRSQGHGHEHHPLFNLPDVAARPEAPVLIVEGEKTAEAAAKLFPDLVVVTWPGGAAKVHRADWRSLAGRNVTLWPDNDDAGAATVPAITDALRAVGVASLRVVKLPLGLPSGWDLADEPPPGLGVRAAVDAAEIVDLKAVTPFHLATYAELIERVVYNVGTEQFVDCVTGLRLQRPQLDALFAHRDSGSMALKLLKDPDLARTIAFGYRPGEPILTLTPEGLRVFNLWRPSGIEPRLGDAGPFVRHVEYLCSTGEEAALLLDWAASLVQRLGQKTMWAPLLRGGQGTGKSLLGEILRRVVGLHNTTMVTTIDLATKFNDWIEAKILIVVEEVMALGRREIMNNIKPLITQPKVPVHTKHLRRYEIENHANFLLLTNHKDALLLDNDDRRFLIIDSDKPPRSPEYYAEFVAWAEQNLDVILHYLLTRDLSGFKPAAPPPMTEGKRQMIEASRHPLEIVVAQALEERDAFPFQYDLVELDEVIKALRGPEGLAAGIEVNRARVQTVLKKLGAVNLGQKVLKERGQQVKKSLWAIRDADKYTAMDSSDVIRAYRSARERSAPY